MVSEAIINPAMMIWARKYAGFIEEYEELLPEYIKKHINYGRMVKNILPGIN